MDHRTDLVPLRTGAARRPSQTPRREPLEAALRRRVTGDVRFDRGSRGLFARDASNFRQVPIGVVLPRSDADVHAVLDECRAREVPVLARGGGTSLGGQCCNEAVVLDFTKYMGHVLAIDPDRRRARVEPGTILDHLRARATEHGLTFGPDPATHDHCTLGGMIGNDSCGVHSVLAEFYGPGARVQDNVEELEVLTYDGVRLRVGPTSPDELERIITGGGRKGEIYAGLRDLRDRYADLIRSRYPQIPRRVSGYNLPALLPENGFDVARALVGSESTCVTVLEATLSLVPALPERVMLVLGYPDVFAAGDVVPAVRALADKPVGCEGMDRRLIDFVQKKGLHAEYTALLPEGDAWLIVQFGADTADEARARAERARAALAPDALGHALYTDQDRRTGIWEIRESGLGATAFVPGEHDTWPGWEDSAVPPDAVGPYLRDLRALFERHDYGAASVYGHFAQGCIHCRIPFDLTSEEGLERYRAFTREAAELVVSHGGSISGEHGDGQQRGELLPIMFGDELMQAFREFKAIWDPDGKMNPGKLIDAMPRSANLALGADYAPRQPATHFAFPDDEGAIAHATLRCVGVGMCRREEPDGVMCPSYFVTREEKHTTRGRAHLLHEMLTGDLITDGWRSEEVKDALDLCISCKGCTSECPVNVDIPTLKSEFLSHYYEGRLRPRHAYAFGLIHRWARVGALVPELANAVTQTPGLRRIAKWAAGMHPERQVPRFARRTFRSWWKHNAPPARGGRRVLLWPDTFNDHFHPDTLAAAASVLHQAGFDVVIPRRRLCCGRPLYEYGMLDTAKKLWRDILGELEDEIRAGTPLVGVEPSCTAAFRDELGNLFPDDELARALKEQTHGLAEFLRKQADGWGPPSLAGQRAMVHHHCHQKAFEGVEDDDAVLDAMELEVERPQATCCGMAGAFGFEKEHYDVSQAIGELALLPAARQASRQTLLLANGFSCREQVAQAAGRRPLHLAELLDAGASGREPSPPPRSIADAGLSTGAKVLLAGLGLGILVGWMARR